MLPKAVDDYVEVDNPVRFIEAFVDGLDLAGAFLTRGLANVRAEFSLTALAYNLRRALNILGAEAMTAGVAA